jgi:hypothetical protein
MYTNTSHRHANTSSIKRQITNKNHPPFSIDVDIICACPLNHFEKQKRVIQKMGVRTSVGERLVVVSINHKTLNLRTARTRMRKGVLGECLVVVRIKHMTRKSGVHGRSITAPKLTQQPLFRHQSNERLVTGKELSPNSVR